MFIELTKEQELAYEFDCRCQMVASHLWQRKSVTMSEKQLQYYGVKPHDVILALAYWVRFEEIEACWEAEDLYRGTHHERVFVVYCTKCRDKYIFRAKVKA